MHIPTNLDPAIKAIFDDPDNPSEAEFHRQLEQLPTDNRWVSEQGYRKQQEFLLKLETQKIRSRLK